MIYREFLSMRKNVIMYGILFLYIILIWEESAIRPHTEEGIYYCD